MPGQDAGAKTGRVEHDDIDRLHGRLGRVGDDRMLPAASRAKKIFAEPLYAVAAKVAGDDEPRGPAHGDGLATGRRACVVDNRARGNIEIADSERLRRLLHEPSSLGIA